MQSHIVIKATGIFAALALALGSNVAAATETRCDGCTEVAYENTARNAGLWEQYVYDIPNGQARKYFVDREPENGQWSYYVYPETVEPAVEFVVTELAAFYYATGGTMKTVGEIYADGAAAGRTAFELAQPGADRTAVLNWFENDFPTSGNLLPMSIAAMHSLGAAALNIFKQVPVETRVVVRLSDGGSVILTFDTLSMSAAYEEGSALDAAGNPIPVSAAQATGINFGFDHAPNGNSAGAADAMQRWLEDLGAHVQGRGTSRIGCVETANGVSCTRT